MVSFRKLLGGLLLAIAVIALGNLWRLHFDYGARMPSVPHPESGRIHPFTANHARVYVTQEEAKTAHHAELAAEVSWIVALAGMYVANRRGRGRTPQAPPGQH